MISIIAAYSKNRAIGKDGDLPWHIPEDLKRFKDLTSGHTVIMGRNTYQSIVARLGHALPNRRNIVISASLSNPPEDVEIAHSLEEAIKMADKDEGGKEIFILGGEKVFSDSLRTGIVDKIYATEIDQIIEGDVFFPEIIKNQWHEDSRIKHIATKTQPLSFAFVTMKNLKSVR